MPNFDVIYHDVLKENTSDPDVCGVWPDKYSRRAEAARRQTESLADLQNPLVSLFKMHSIGAWRG